MLYTCCRLQLASFDKVDAASFGQKAKLMFRRRILKHRGMPLERAGYELTVLVLSSPSSVLLSGWAGCALLRYAGWLSLVDGVRVSRMINKYLRLLLMPMVEAVYLISKRTVLSTPFCFLRWEGSSWSASTYCLPHCCFLRYFAIVCIWTCLRCFQY